VAVPNFQEERDRIAAELTDARQRESQLAAEIGQLTADLTRVKARIASLEAEDRVYAGQTGNLASAPGTGDLSRMTIRKAILTVLGEAKPEPLQLRDLERTMADRGKRVSSGVSVDLNALKSAGEVLNPSWGYWTVP
jgi:chromosome segregation ATPase